MNKRELDYIKISELNEKKIELKNQMLDEIEKLKEKYVEPFKAIDEEMKKYQDFIMERDKKLSDYSAFPRKDIIEALLYVLSEVHDKEFTYTYAETLTPRDSRGLEHGVGIIAPKEVSDTFLESNEVVEGSWIMYYPTRITDMVLIQRYRVPVITDERIAFYFLDGTRTIDQKKYECIYDFINCLVDYRWVYDKDTITKDEIMACAKSYVETYKNNEKGKVKKK